MRVILSLLLHLVCAQVGETFEEKVERLRKAPFIFKAVAKRATWKTARLWCKAHKGDLAEINTSKELKRVIREVDTIDR